MKKQLKILVFLFCYFVIGNCMTLDLKEPALVTWNVNGKNSTLLIYNLQTQSILTCNKYSQSPIDYTYSSSQFIISNQNAYYYKPINMQYKVNVQYFYSGWNGITQFGFINASSIIQYDNNDGSQGNFSNKQHINANNKINNGTSNNNNMAQLFTVRPLITQQHKKLPKYIYFQTDSDPNTYTIPLQTFSKTPKCNKIFPFTDQSLLSLPYACLPITTKSIIRNNLYTDIHSQVTNLRNSSNLSMLQNSNASSQSYQRMGIQFDINSAIIGSNMKIQSLSSFTVDLSKVIISIKNFKDGINQKIKVSIDNIGTTFAYVTLKCIQNGQVLYQSNLLILQNSYQIFQIFLSTTSPNSNINFIITNPFTSQFYTFTNPSQIVKDVQWTTFSLSGGNYVPVVGISIGMIVGISVGGIFVISIIVVFVYRKINKLKAIKKQQKSGNSTISSRQLIHSTSTNRNDNSQTLSLTPDLQTFRKQKPQSLTTLDSQKNQISQKLSISQKNYEYQQNQKLPSLADKIQQRYRQKEQKQLQKQQYLTKQQQLQLSQQYQLPKFKMNNRRSSSAQQLLVVPNRNKNNCCKRSMQLDIALRDSVDIFLARQKILINQGKMENLQNVQI